MGVGVEVGVTVGVLVAAAAVRATAVAVCSSGDGPQPDNNTPIRIMANPIHIFVFDGILKLLLNDYLCRRNYKIFE